MNYPRSTESLVNTPSKEGERNTGSFLVRLWIESTDDEVPVRGYVRNLRTGEECYVGDTGRLGEHLLRQLRGEQKQEDVAPESHQSTQQSA